VKEWNESGYGIIVNRLSEFVNIRFFGSVSATPYPLLTANNRSVGHNLLVHRTLQFDEETTADEFFTQHPPFLYMRRCETRLINVALNITVILVDPTFAIAQPVLLENDVTFISGVNLLSGHFHGDFLAKQEQTTWPPRGTRYARQPSNSLLLVAFAIAIIIFWHLERIRDALHRAWAVSHVRTDSLESRNQTMQNYLKQVKGYRYREIAPGRGLDGN
jgi:hypothetical protein